MLKIKLILGLLVACATSMSFALSPDVRSMGPSYQHEDKTLRDVEFPNDVGRAWQLCYPREIFIDLSSKSPGDKRQVTMRFIEGRQAIAQFIRDSLEKAVQRSNQIFADSMPQIAPKLVELLEKRGRRDELWEIGYTSLSAPQKSELSTAEARITELENELFGVWNSKDRVHEGGLIPPMDARRKIADFSEVRFFGPSPEELQQRNYERNPDLYHYQSIEYYFRVQGALTRGPVSTGIFNTGQFGEKNVTSDFFNKIEDFVADTLEISDSLVTIQGAKSLAENNRKCQRDELFPLLDI